MGSLGANKNTVSESIRTEFINKALNSRLKGVKRDAEAGTGNYSFKNATAVSSDEAMTMNSISFMERDGKTLAHGLIGERHVFYANDTNAETIQALKEREKQLKSGNLSKGNTEINTTTTYDRWRKNNQKKFDAWFGKR